MGRQIRFFMHGDDEIKFIELVEYFGDSISDRGGNPFDISKLNGFLLHKEEITDSSKLTILFIIFPESKLVKRESGYINPVEADVIEFSRCDITDNNQIWEGRLWAEFKYYDENGTLKSKDKWFEQKFNKYRNWIKKNLRISVDKDYYIGEEAYKLYREKGYRMKAGPKVEIKF